MNRARFIQSPPEIISIDLTNRCGKGCPFCYNASHPTGLTEWTADEVIAFATDCTANGVKAVSLGGGEPFEHPGIFDIIAALYPLAYLTVTTNGLPLAEASLREHLADIHPDKIHISIHNPEDAKECHRIMEQLRWLESAGIKAGVNLLVTKRNLSAARDVYRLLRGVIDNSQIILLPIRFADTPTPDELASITSGEPFQCASCLIECHIPRDFVSVSWDKKVNFCSFAGGKIALPSLSYSGMMSALNQVSFISCLSN